MHWSRGGRIGGRGGFTLIEILMALTISTLILAAATAIFVTTMRQWESGSEVRERLHAARQVGDLIERHLRSALAPVGSGNTIFLGEDLSVAGGADPATGEEGATPMMAEEGAGYGHRLTLISTAAGRFPRDVGMTDRTEICFELDPLEEDGMTMRIQAPPDDEPEEGGYLVKLSPLIRGFEVFYYDGETWEDEWLGSGLPRAVEFRLWLEAATETGPERRGGALKVSRLVSMPQALWAEEEESGEFEMELDGEMGNPANGQAQGGPQG